MSRLQERMAELRAQMGVQKRDRQRLIVFAVAFLVLLGAVVASFLAGGSGDSGAAEDGPAAESTGDIDRLKIEMVPDPGDEVAEAGIQIFTPNLALNDPQIESERLAAVRDGSRAEQEIIEEEPLAYLLSLIHHRAFDGELAKRSGRPYRPLVPKNLFDAPGGHRGRPVDFRARLLDGSRIDLARPPGLENAYRGFARLIDEDVVVSFTLTDAPVGIEPGDVIRVRGLFLKIWYASPPGELRGGPTLHFVASFRTGDAQFSGLVKSFVPESPTEIDPDWLSGPYVIREPSTLPLFRMLAYLKSRPLREYREQRASGEIPQVGIDELGGSTPENAVVDVGDHFYKLSERLRGRRVRASGSLLEFAAYATPENPGGFERIYHGAIEGRRRALLFVTPFHPETYYQLERRVGQQVAVEGYLWASREYEARDGKSLRAPLLVVTDVYMLEFQESALSRYGPTIVLVAVGALGLAIVVFLMRDRRDTLKFEDRRREARRRRAGGAPTAVPAGDEAPGG